MKRVIFILIAIFISTFAFSNERSELLLDEAIEEFSKENYERALEIIEIVLEEEPDNSVAKMYKKTIEDVSKMDEVESAQETQVTTQTETREVETVSEVPQNEVQEVETADQPIFSMDTVLSSTSSKGFTIEERFKLYLGLPVLEFGVRTDRIDYDISKSSGEIFPFDEILIADQNWMDFSIGLRYIPTSVFGTKPGFFDFKLGCSSFYNYSDAQIGTAVIPFIGFDTEVTPLGALGENPLFQSFWIGGSGSLHIFNGDMVNNSSYQLKAGFNISFFNLGFSYKVDSIESIGLDTTSYGLILGFEL